jgi:hypothetical protein
MTITLTPATEARLREQAAREGADINHVAEALIVAGLEWDAQELAETIEAVRLADQASAEGRECGLADFIAKQRRKYGFPAS